MTKKIQILILIFNIFFIAQVGLSANEFYFEGEEIQILDEGNKLVSKKGVKITTKNDLIFEGNEFEYDKKKLELILSDNVIIQDIRKNINIKADKIIYFKSDEKLITNQSTQININNEYLIESNDITFDRTKGVLGSNKNTTIKDSYNNKLNSSEFKFFIEEQLVKAKNVSIKDNLGNITSLENFIGNKNAV